MGWQWHQLDHMQIIYTCSLQTDNRASTSSLNYLQAACSSWRPTNKCVHIVGCDSEQRERLIPTRRSETADEWIWGLSAVQPAWLDPPATGNVSSHCFLIFCQYISCCLQCFDAVFITHVYKPVGGHFHQFAVLKLLFLYWNSHSTPVMENVLAKKPGVDLLESLEWVG